MDFLSNRIRQVKPSATLAVAARAKELQAMGRDVIDLGAGEPDFDTPKHIKKAARQALKSGFTKYTAVSGIAELKQAVINKISNDNGLVYQPNEIVVTVGGKQAFYNLAQATLNPGDEVIIPAPYWVSYPDMVLLAEGKPVIVDSDEANGFKLTAAQLEQAITAKTKYVVINSPSNPTGSAYSKDELMALGTMLQRHPQVWAIVDDIYEKIIFDGFQFFTLAQVVPELKPRTLLLNGVSKSYAMTGWRIGYAAGPAPIIKAMETIQSQSTSCATSIAQKAAVAALSGPQKCIKPMLKAFQARRDYVVAELNNMPGISCRAPEGAFYVYPCIAGLIGRKTPDGQTINDSVALAAHLLDNQGVAMVPGVAFGKDPYFRISFATSMENLEQAMRRIRIVAEQLTAN
ncbi:MAG: pyridoxal phosphate-dependent aminotransferase [Magnetococcales bacterium]|nr:pyridoxal phosphate-dependent aminotransferase [Magnetococcales bacterium]